MPIYAVEVAVICDDIVEDGIAVLRRSCTHWGSTRRGQRHDGARYR